MDTAALDYELPASAIAQVPVEPRDAARMLVDAGPGQAPSHERVADLARHVGSGDVVVVNTTRVLPARLALAKPTGGRVEVLLLAPSPAGQWERWEALVRPGRRVPPGTRLVASDALTVEVGEHLDEPGARAVRLVSADPQAALEHHGAVPLPPYVGAELADPERYQTVYADRPASVAAPTAGLHLTEAVIGRIGAAGARVVPVELEVGLGTFRPITASRVEDHRMHAERYRVPESTMDAVTAADRVVAVGTTTVRALESAHRTGELEGDTRLFLHGDERVASVDVLLTNFHLPRSSLLALVEVFVGPRWRALYALAVAEGYRFLSFGDAMLLRGIRG